jgi:hypothetical protein
MPSYGLLRPKALVGNDVSDESIASIIRVRRIGKLQYGISSQGASVASYC